MHVLPLPQKTKKNLKQTSDGNNRRKYSGKGWKFGFLQGGVNNAGEECGSELLGCEYDKTTGKPFPFESSNTFLSAFGGDRVTGGMVSGDSRNREKWVQFLFEIKHDGF
jgi:hypothetical protein